MRNVSLQVNNDAILSSQYNKNMLPNVNERTILIEATIMLEKKTSLVKCIIEIANLQQKLIPQNIFGYQNYIV